MDGLKMKKKILFMVQVPPPIHGAALRNLSLYESKLLHDKFNIKLVPLAFADNISDIGKLSVRKVYKTFRYSFKLISSLISFKPDTAYFTLTPAGGAFYRDCLFVLILKMTKTSIIYHLRGLGINQARNKNRLNKVLYSFVFRNSFVVCLSKNQLEDIQGLSYTKHFIVPNGIKTEFNPVSKQEIKPGKMHLLFLSNFLKSKGVYEFLEALKKLKNERVEFEAVLVGANGNVTKADIQQYIDNANLNDCVKVMGPYFGREKFRLISECDIFILPTYFELFPGVILEAMQCGKPVVSTFIGAISEIIDNGENGLLVKPRNVDQLAEKIRYLIERPDVADLMGKNAIKKFNKEYTLERFEVNMRQVFDEV
jgi:glycosyltransferase involved in cell wall biosynthesis